jgi:hypothetical protein
MEPLALPGVSAEGLPAVAGGGRTKSPKQAGRVLSESGAGQSSRTRRDARQAKRQSRPVKAVWAGGDWRGESVRYPGTSRRAAVARM